MDVPVFEDLVTMSATIADLTASVIRTDDRAGIHGSNTKIRRG